MIGQPGLHIEFPGSQDFTEMGKRALLWRTIQNGAQHFCTENASCRTYISAVM